jgi:hypothetical protein
MNDFLGKEIKIGDTVAFYESDYRNFVKGTVIAFTPKMVRVEYTRSGYMFNKSQYCYYPSNFIVVPL